MTEIPQTCPHCNVQMKKWATPDMSSWDSEMQYVCFNDDCPYYQNGWEWMEQNYAQRASYRYRLNPETGERGPVPVWSPEALRDGIIEGE